MDRSKHLSTFSQYPESSDEAVAGFSTDLHATQGGQPRDQAGDSRLARVARGATGLALRLIDRLTNSSFHVEGMHNVGKGPVLFVANHFTRLETFVLPWLIHNANRGRMPHSLAYHELFRGRFGDFLMTMGARPTGDPVVKHTIVEDLMTGRHDWLIYPEGSMIKNKKIWSNGRFSIDSPDRAGSIHTGAAIMALKAMMYKRLYRQACAQGDRALMARYEKRYHLDGPADIDAPDLQVVPVNITYYPIRPGKNLIYRLARRFFRTMPSMLEEELAIEGSLLLSETDISIYFGKPIDLTRYLNLVMPTLLAPMPFVEQLRSANRTLGALKNRLTRRMMHEVYTRLTINFDHLFAGGVRALATGHAHRERIASSDFHQALYLAARQIQAAGKRRSHPSIGPELLDMLCGEPFKPLASALALAREEGLVEVEDGDYRINQVAVKHEHSFHDIRLKNTLAVIANELEPMRSAVRQLRNAVYLPRTVLHRQVAALLRDEEREDFAVERRAHLAAGQLKPEEIGRPFILQRPDDRVGIVLSHGYLAAPEEIRPLAEHLHRLGFAVHGVRLPGHGTAPAALDAVTAEDWLRAYQRAYLAMRNTCQHVIVAGFSAGALLALATAARHPEVAGVVAINPSLRISDRMSMLVPAVCRWNRMLDTLHLGSARFDRVDNHAENPQINYPVNFLNGVHQLERLIGRCRERLAEVAAPTLVIQGDRDPVIDPGCGRMAIDQLGAEEKELAMMAFDRHVIVRGDGSETVLQRVGDFALGLAERLRTDRHERDAARRRRAPAVG